MDRTSTSTAARPARRFSAALASLVLALCASCANPAIAGGSAQAEQPVGAAEPADRPAALAASATADPAAACAPAPEIAPTEAAVDAGDAADDRSSHQIPLWSLVPHLTIEGIVLPSWVSSTSQWTPKQAAPVEDCR